MIRVFVNLLIIMFCLCKVSGQNSELAEQNEGILSIFNKGGEGTVIINQISFRNWARGGENSVSATGILNLFANFIKHNFEWENKLDTKYGLQNTDEQGMRTNQDVLDALSKFGYKAIDKLFYTGLINFKTQFTPGYNYPNDSVAVSGFFAPAFLIASIGMDLKPNEELSIYLSPMTGKFVFVNNREIADVGAFTGEPALVDNLGKIIRHGKKSRADFGAYLRINYRRELMENISLKTRLEIFNNYTDKIIKNRSNFDIDSETYLTMKVNEFISASIILHFIYDHDIKIPSYEIINGVKTQVGAGPRLQMKEVIGIGISYNFK